MGFEETKLKGDELVPYIFTNNNYRTPWSIAEKVAKAQSEISFKMGYNQALKDIKAGLSPSDMV